VVDASHRQGASVIAAGIGAAWAVLAAVPLVWRGARSGVRDRAGGLRVTVPVAPRAGSPFVAAARTRVARLAGLAGGGVVGRVVGGLRARRAGRRTDAEIRRDLPVVLDLLGVAIGAGCTPYLAVDAAVRWSPPGLGARLDRVVRATRLGAAFPDALDELARTAPGLEPLVDALLASDRLGAPVGPALARLAGEERAASRRRAEAQARRVPVRLLFPLVFLVLPAFGLLTVVPALLSGLART
jgi:tight adherence protein C